MTTRKLAALTIGLLLLAGCGGSPSAPAPSPSTPASTPSSSATTPKQPMKAKIVITIDNLALMPVFVADAKGFFKQEGVEPTFVSMGGAQATEALTNGSVEFVAGNGSSVPLAWSKNVKNIVAVGNIVDKATANTVMSNAAAKRLGEDPSLPLNERLKRLKGSTFAVLGLGSADDNILSVMLKQAGLQRGTDVKVVDAGSAVNMVTALEHGQVDAFTSSPPTSTQIAADGKGLILITGGTVPGTDHISWDGLETSADLIAKNPTLVRAVAHAIGRAINYCDDPAHTAEITQIAQKRYSKISPQLIADGVKYMLASKAWPKDGAMDEAIWKNQIAMDNAGGKAAGEASLDTSEGKMWTNQFVKDINGQE